MDWLLQQSINGLGLGSIYALIALGYKQVDSRKAVRAILEKEPAATAEILIRGALRSLQG